MDHLYVFDVRVLKIWTALLLHAVRKCLRFLLDGVRQALFAVNGWYRKFLVSQDLRHPPEVIGIFFHLADFVLPGVVSKVGDEGFDFCRQTVEGPSVVRSPGQLPSAPCPVLFTNNRSDVFWQGEIVFGYVAGDRGVFDGGLHRGC